MKNKYSMTFGQRLRMLLDERKMSQKDLANRIMYNNSSISYWCADACEPRLTAIAALSKEFGVSTDYLIFGKEQK